MLTIGLTGPSGAGKGLVASLFARYGVPSIDTDTVYHALLMPPSACLDELVERFGQQVLRPDGTLDRTALSAVVFDPANADALADLNRISHRHVLERVREMLGDHEQAGTPAVLVDAPQLFESGFDAECDKVLSVIAPRELRLARIIERDGLSPERATARLDAQLSEQIFRERADHVMINDGEIEPLDEEIRRLLQIWEVAT